jgi:predicted PilT family ATPase
MIPSSLTAYVIGAKGKNLKEIREKTGVNVNIPKQDPTANGQQNKATGDIDYDLDDQIPVTIDGDEINVRTAKDMIMSIVLEKTSRTVQRLTNIDHIFYPFIAGPKGANLARLEQGGDVTIKVPPRAAFLPQKEAEAEASEPRRERDLSIIVSGDREAVNRAVQSIESQVEEMNRTFRTIQVKLPKRQHRFLVGDAAQDILATTSCSVELAPIDDPSDSVTIRGPQSGLAEGLTAVMNKANAVNVEIVDVASIHRDLNHAKTLLRWLSVSGKLPREPNVQVFIPRAAIVESTGSTQIEIVGADADSVNLVRSQVDSLVKSIPPSFTSTLDIDPLLHRFIIGKKGAGLNQYAKKGVDVVFPAAPTDDSTGEARSDVTLVLADAALVGSLPSERKAREAAVAAILKDVEEDIMKASQQAADLKTEVVEVPAKFHRAILGPNGTTLNAIIGEDRLVAVKLGSSASSSAAAKGPNKDEDTITVRGPSVEVQRVCAELRRIAEEAEQDAIVNGHTAEFTIDSSHIPHIVGRGGASVTKLREDLGVRIDFGDNVEASGKKAAKAKVVITGRKENVEEAKKRILSQADKLADETSLTLKVPAHLHGSIIGQGGKYVTRLQDNYSVRINFPHQGEAERKSDQKPDEIIIKGGKKGVEGARVELLELIEYEKENNNVITVPVSSKSIARIMGRGGVNVNRIRDETDAQIDVDREEDRNDNGTTIIKLRGTKQAIAAAKKEILAVAADVDAEESYSLRIPAKFHGQLIGPGGQNLRDIIASAGGPTDSRAAAQLIQFPRKGGDPSNADIVQVRGPADVAAKIKAELDRIVADLNDRIVVGVIVAPSQQKSLMGRIRELQSMHKSAKIIVPSWKEYGALEINNAEELKGASPDSIVKIQGSQSACKALQAEIAESFSANSKTMQIPRAVAQRLAGSNIFRQIRSEYGVQIDAPRVGPASAVNAAKPNAPAARIDADEMDADDLPYEVTKLDLSSSDGSVTWSLTSKSMSSLQEAEKELQKEIDKLSNFTTQGRLWVDQRAIPRIVGRGGSGLRDIESQTDTLVEIPREGGGLVIIQGTEESVEEARQRIARIASQRGRD